MPQSRAAAASRTRTRAQQLAIAVLALLLMALLGFYTLVTGRITDGSAKNKDALAQALELLQAAAPASCMRERGS